MDLQKVITLLESLRDKKDLQFKGSNVGFLKEILRYKYPSREFVIVPDFREIYEVVSSGSTQFDVIDEPNLILFGNLNFSIDGSKSSLGDSLLIDSVVDIADSKVRYRKYVDVKEPLSGVGYVDFNADNIITNKLTISGYDITQGYLLSGYFVGYIAYWS